MRWAALYLLSAAALARAPGASAVISDADCPAWIAEYAQFHTETRNAAGPVKRLTYSCEHSGEGGGFGDRFRALVWGVRLAAATKRVLHIKMTHPVKLEDFLEPAAIDWRPYPGDDIRITHGARTRGPPTRAALSMKASFTDAFPPTRSTPLRPAKQAPGRRRT